MRDDIIRAKDQIIKRLKNGETRVSIAKEFKCKIHTLSKYVNSWGYKELKNPGRKGISHKEAYKPAKFYLGTNKFINSHILKLKLWKENIKPKHCEKCKWAETSIDGRLPLELDHIDGNHWNNELSNLMILCPNCHALKPGNSGNANKE